VTPLWCICVLSTSRSTFSLQYLYARTWRLPCPSVPSLVGVPWELVCPMSCKVGPGVCHACFVTGANSLGHKSLRPLAKNGFRADSIPCCICINKACRSAVFQTCKRLCCVNDRSATAPAQSSLATPLQHPCSNTVLLCGSILALF